MKKSLFLVLLSAGQLSAAGIHYHLLTPIPDVVQFSNEKLSWTEPQLRAATYSVPLTRGQLLPIGRHKVNYTVTATDGSGSVHNKVFHVFVFPHTQIQLRQHHSGPRHGQFITWSEQSGFGYTLQHSRDGKRWSQSSHKSGTLLPPTLSLNLFRLKIFFTPDHKIFNHAHE